MKTADSFTGLIAILFVALGAPRPGLADDLCVLHYDHPIAENLKRLNHSVPRSLINARFMGQALPLGNGRFGAMFSGHVDLEYLVFNDITLWMNSTRGESALKQSGSPADGKDYLELVRAACREGKYGAKEDSVESLGTKYLASKQHLGNSATFAVLLASLSALQAAESPASAANPERMPAFSWNTVPLYVHIRKDTAFTDAEIRYLATFPLITFEKATGNTDSGSVEAGTLKAARAVKAINPDTKILYYRNVIVHYGGYAADASLKSIPGAFLVGRDGNDKLIRNRLQAYDLTNKALRDWWIDAAKEVCSDPAIDGVFLDGVVKILEPAFLKGPIGEEKKAAELAGYVTMMEDTRKMLGPQKLMVANILRARFSDSGLSYIKALDGSYIEGFEGTVGVSKKDYVAQGIRDFQKAARRGVIVAYTCGLDENQQDADEAPRSAASSTNPVRRGRNAKSRFNYELAIFLICAEKYSYFDLKDGYDAKTSKTWMTHRADYHRPLGPPNGPAVRSGYTYAREFAHASVQLDIENETANIVWKQQEQQ